LVICAHLQCAKFFVVGDPDVSRLANIFNAASRQVGVRKNIDTVNHL